MKKSLSIAHGALALGFILAAGFSAAQEQGPVTGDAERGALLYYQHTCYGCHGFNGYGRQELNNTGSPFLLNEEVFTAFLRARQDVAPLFPVTSMPNYPANALPDQDAKDIYAYIRSMPENMPEIDEIPAFQAIMESARASYDP